MQVFKSYENLPDSIRNGVVAIGNFDGVHRGHQTVIGEAGRYAKAGGMPWSVLTFEPHPRHIFTPDGPPFRITPASAKAQAIQNLGVDALIVLTFNKSFSERTPDSFIHEVLVEGLNAQHVVAGYDFKFGHKRAGNCELLLRKGQEGGFDFTAVQAQNDDDGGIISSTRVRDFLSNGKPTSAANLLGRAFEIEGEVQHGDERGRTIGFPTANVFLGDYMRPVNGVYAVRVTINGTTHDGVANLGHRPTFDGQDVTLEAHLFDFSDDLYGQIVRVALIDYLRPEKKFDGIDDLKAQIGLDSDRAREILRKTLTDET
jgi:riboflavin kinase / FMN adenylyltransferase